METALYFTDYLTTRLPDYSTCLFLKKVDSIFTLKINNSISVRNPLTLLPA